MSHEITIRESGLAEFAYVGEQGWHKLGQSIEAYLATIGLSVGTASPEQMEHAWAKCAGMDWKILRSKVRYFADREGKDQRTIDDAHVLMRSDTGADLGIVSDKYKTVQPAQVLAFFHELSAALGVKLETAGTLFGGKKFYATARIGGEYIFGNSGDKLRPYLLLATSCDGSAKTTARDIITRVVCDNTMSAAMSEATKHVVNLSHRSVFDAQKIRDQLGIVDTLATAQACESLTQVRMSDDKACDFVRNLLRPEDAAKKAATIAEAQAKTARILASASGSQDFARLLGGTVKLADVATDEKRAPKGEAEILRLFRGAAIGSNLSGVRGTAWGMLNAVTEYVDHKASAKTDSHRMQSALFNGGDELKTSAFEQLLAMR
jgi:phage/plasmid-like protein (TIGR03299 family)